MISRSQEYGNGSVPLITSGVSSLEPGDYGFPDIKTGINLPKSDDQWITANEYFKSILFLNPPITAQNLSSSIKLLNDTIYVHNTSKHKVYKYLFYLQMPLHNISNSVFSESPITCVTCEPRQLLVLAIALK